MPVLPVVRIGQLLEPYFPSPSDALLAQLSDYLDLLIKWNERTNLTSIRGAEEIVSRHFGESLFTALHLPPARNLLDLGSGAGFPGLPIQLALPALEVTLAESQNKKSTFLQELIRVLDISSTTVWAGRVEDMPSDQRFDVVTLRAVDRPDVALNLARNRLRTDGVIAHLTSSADFAGVAIPLPGSTQRFLHIIKAP